MTAAILHNFYFLAFTIAAPISAADMGLAEACDLKHKQRMAVGVWLRAWVTATNIDIKKMLLKDGNYINMNVWSAFLLDASFVPPYKGGIFYG